MVIYFSGTGNSRYVAERIAYALDESLHDLGKTIKRGDTIALQGKVIIVTPTYAWRMPRVVEDWLSVTDISATKIWFVMTCGDDNGSAAEYNSRICSRVCECEYMGTKSVVMPENYIAMFETPDKASAVKIVEKAEQSIDSAISAIKDGRTFSDRRSNMRDKLFSGPVNAAFYSIFVNARAFTVGDKCISCGSCFTFCPTNAIKMENGRPVWGKGCTHCMACICRCPQQAIEYGRKSRGQNRYTFESLGLS